MNELLTLITLTALLTYWEKDQSDNLGYAHNIKEKI